MTRLYRLHGLTLESAWELPALAAAPAPAGAPDVAVRLAEAPLRPPPPAESLQFTLLGASSAEFYTLEMPGVARYWVEAGRTITLAPAPAADPAAVQQFLLGPVWGALWHQRAEGLPLHASAVLTPRGVVAVLGGPSVGKSTLAAALSQRGCALLADDVTVVQRDAHGRLVAWPGAPDVQLWPPALAALGWSDADYAPVRAGLPKRRVPRPPAPWASHPVRALLGLQSVNRPTGTLEALTGAAAWRFITRNIYGAAWHGPAAFPAQKLPLQAALLGAPLMQVGRPAQADDVTASIRALVDTLTQAGWL